jgi:hypothetical protein
LDADKAKVNEDSAMHAVLGPESGHFMSGGHTMCHIAADEL